MSTPEERARIWEQARPVIQPTLARAWEMRPDLGATPERFLTWANDLCRILMNMEENHAPPRYIDHYADTIWARINSHLPPSPEQWNPLVRWFFVPAQQRNLDARAARDAREAAQAAQNPAGPSTGAAAGTSTGAAAGPSAHDADHSAHAAGPSVRDAGPSTARDAQLPSDHAEPAANPAEVPAQGAPVQRTLRDTAAHRGRALFAQPVRPAPAQPRQQVWVEVPPLPRRRIALPPIAALPQSTESQASDDDSSMQVDELLESEHDAPVAPVSTTSTPRSGLKRQDPELIKTARALSELECTGSYKVSNMIARCI
ncbi:hypothetical protein BV20DRAFT_1055583 [Pilatotrama ljubarskyi]|nr:hypothetical protein BV20DRAFT_1055583 [Pilatotrama ljubarskyi]